MNQPTSTEWLPNKCNFVAKKVISTLCYFDLFNYPLTAKEIFERSGVDSIETVERILNYLANDKSIFEHEVLFTQ